jgi:drug/metabolite transporter (DMT)-like permease
MSTPFSMPPQAIALSFVAAGFHAGWNLLLKGARQREAFAWWGMLVGFVGFLPILVLGPAMPVRVWPFAGASGLVEVAYFAALNRAYQDGDFSLVYPVARGLTPVLLALFALVFLGEVPSVAGVAGLALVFAGIALVGGALGIFRGTAPGWRSLGHAAAVAVCSSTCSAIDAAAVRFSPAAGYSVLITGLTALLMFPVLLARGGRAGLTSALDAGLKRILGVALGLMLAYLFALQAFAIAPVGYVGAVREVSVVLAALAGWLWLGEGFGLERLAGAALIFAGLLAIAIGG